MSQIAQARVESSGQSQSSDTSLFRDTDESERSAQVGSQVARTTKPSSSKPKIHKALSPVTPSYSFLATALNNNDKEDEQEEGELSSTSEDRGSTDRPIRKRSRSPSEESFDQSSNISDVEEDSIRQDRSFAERSLASENRGSQNQRQNARVIVP